jgi:hypothetical protein
MKREWHKEESYQEAVRAVAQRVCPNKKEGPCPECSDDAERFLIGRLDHRINHTPFKQAAQDAVADAL